MAFAAGRFAPAFAFAAAAILARTCAYMYVLGRPPRGQARRGDLALIGQGSHIWLGWLSFRTTRLWQESAARQLA